MFTRRIYYDELCIWYVTNPTAAEIDILTDYKAAD